MTRYSPYPAWNVLPHEPMERLDENLFRLEGTLEGMPIRRVMTIGRRSDGQLVMHSPIAVDEATANEIESLGPVGFVAVPSGYHRLDVAGYRQRYPDAKILCPRGARARVDKVARTDGVYDDYPEDSEVTLFTLPGTEDLEGAMIVRSPSGTTLVLNDVLFNMPHMKGVKGFILKNVTKSSGGPRVSRIARLGIVKDKAVVRSELERLADIPDLIRIIVSHHLPIDDNPREVLRSVAASLG